VLLCDLPSPTFLPQIHYDFNHYLKIEFTYGALQGLLWLAYYYILDPLGAVRLIQICCQRQTHRYMLQFLYTPQAILSILTANAFAQRANHTNIAIIVHVASWVAQILAHKFAEGRSPALLDNPVNGSSLSRLIRNTH
jgi:uncharacterized membrane protein YGL010W